MSYRAFFQPVKTLTQAQRQEMASLYFMYYTGSDGTQFLSDLDHKQEVLFLMSGDEMAGSVPCSFIRSADTGLSIPATQLCIPPTGSSRRCTVPGCGVLRFCAVNILANGCSGSCW